MKKTITTKKCSNCGEEIKSSAKYCGRCGSELPESVEQEPARMPQYVREEQWKSWTKMIDVLQGIAIMGFIAVMIGLVIPFMKLQTGEETISILRGAFQIPTMCLILIIMIVIAVLGIVKVDGGIAVIAAIVLIILATQMPYIFTLSFLRHTAENTDEWTWTYAEAAWLFHSNFVQDIGYYAILGGSIIAAVSSAISNVVRWGADLLYERKKK